ncbi:MAG: hypothetical protein JO356_07470 [Acidobacteria bacterium]|nr:hypothetical protein [Acidobacteriota bacterium]
MVTQKTREIGIRMALGSTLREAILHIEVPGVRAAGLGLTIGLILCTGVLRVMHSVLYGVAVYDVPAIASAVLVLALVTLCAPSVPACASHESIHSGDFA